jgi:hypothetical protein
MNIILNRNLRWPVLLLAFVASACSLVPSKSEPASSSSTGNPSTKGSSSLSASAFSPSNDPRKDFRDALDRLRSAYPFRLTEVSSGSANGREIPEGTRVVDFAAADRSHAKWMNGPLGDTEVITIGDKAYTKLNNGKWTEGAATSAARREGTPERMRELLASVIKDAKYAGPETVNGVACHAYTYAIDGELAGQRWLGTAKCWIRASDGLPQQIDSELNTSSYKAKSHITYEYSVDVKVEKPTM